LIKIRNLIRQGWEEVASEYAKDRIGIFERSAHRLLELLDLPLESTVLDVGCGNGIVTHQAHTWVGPKGKVFGTDIAAAMVRLGRTSTKYKIYTDFCQMDAEWLGFANASFDIVVCAYSLFQFTDMDQALNEMWRVLKPGGKLGLSNWGPGYVSPVASLQRNLFREFGIKPLLTNPIVIKPAVLKRMLTTAGFTNMTMIEETDSVYFASPEQVWDFNMDMGPFPVMLRRQLTKVEQRDLIDRFKTMLQDLITEGGIKSTFHLLYAIAEKGD
jgi:ubiquinone/menaquinone biosynthesis C-methylase UbiE